MDTSQILSIALGGTTIAALGSIAEYMKEKQMPRAKGIMRDFIIGAVLTLLLFQLLPDSMNELSNFFPSLSSLSSLSSVIPSFASVGLDPELQVGIPKF
jgi:hypothetical protein